MKRIGIFCGILLGILTAGLYWWFSQTEFVRAQEQVIDTESKNLSDRDKNVPKEKVERAYAEAQAIQDAILATIKKNKTNFRLYRTSARHIKYGSNPGRRGETRNEMSWRTENTKISVTIGLGLSKEEELSNFLPALDHISMGEFFEAAGFGEKAILVKNVDFNRKVTQVSLHFVKARALVHIYVQNHQRSRAKNEKELMQVARLIEPLIVAKENFDDL
ncbi:MAG: hypothetical protein ACRD6X_15800 [Pyrinomonadaceae bacterium]